MGAGKLIQTALIALGFIFLISFISVPISYAQTTPLVAAGPSAGLEGNPNDIVKWCEEDGEGVRYASANIDLKGYDKCGELKAQKTCDASGQRFISPSSTAPHGYLDCEIGPRIYVRRHLDLESDVLEFQDFREDGTGAHVKNTTPEMERKADPLADYMQSLDSLLQSNFSPSSKNEKTSKRRSSKRGKRHSRNNSTAPLSVPGMGQYEKMLEPYLRQHGISPDVLKPPKTKQDVKRQEKAVKKLFDSLDPDSRRLVEQFLGGKDLDKMLNQSL